MKHMTQSCPFTDTAKELAARGEVTRVNSIPLAINVNKCLQYIYYRRTRTGPRNCAMISFHLFINREKNKRKDGLIYLIYPLVT